MPQNDDEEHLTENNQNNSNTYTLSELPARSNNGITIEVALFLTMLAISLAGTAVSNIILYRTCVHALHHSEDECRLFLVPDKSNTTNGLEQEVQKYATFVGTVKTVLESLGTALLSLLLGVWSDTNGRKPIIVWPLFGIAISGMMVVVFSLMNNLGPWWYILTAIPYSLTGGFTVLFTGAFCYLSDVTSTENRSIRMTLLEAAVSMGSLIGSVSCSYLLKAIGNVYLLLLATALQVLAYAFTNIYLRESLVGALEGGLSTVFDFLLVKEMITECFKRRPNFVRAQIFLLCIANTLSIFILYGSAQLDYMYTRTKLHWSLKDYTIFSASSTTIAFIGSMLAVTLGQKCLRISDLAFSIIAFLTGTVEYIIKALAVTSWQMYMGATIASVKGLSAPLIRSFLTKILPVEDIAKVFVMLCAFEGFCPLLAPVIYNSLYAVTISTFPGAIYILSAGITAISLILLGFVQYYQFKTQSSYQSLTVSIND